MVKGAGQIEYSAKGAVWMEGRICRWRIGNCEDCESSGVDCSEEHAPGSAKDGGKNKGGRAVVEADGALFCITSNACDHREGTNHVYIMLDTTEEGMEVGGAEEAGTIIAVGCELKGGSGCGSRLMWGAGKVVGNGGVGGSRSGSGEKWNLPGSCVHIGSKIAKGA